MLNSDVDRLREDIKSITEIMEGVQKKMIVN